MVQDGSKRGPGEPSRQPKKPKRGQKGAQERPKNSPREDQNANSSKSNSLTKTSLKTNENTAFFNVFGATGMARAAQDGRIRAEDGFKRA